MKKIPVLFSLLFLFQIAFGQWNALGWNPYLIRDTSGDSTFQLSAPSRYDLQRGIASWVPASSGASYLVYTALLTQTGTDAPVATVLENTLGGTVVWTYEGSGEYATSGISFVSNKTAIFFTSPKSSNGEVIAQAYANDENKVLIKAWISSTPTNIDTPSDIYGTIEIRVYP